MQWHPEQEIWGPPRFSLLWNFLAGFGTLPNNFGGLYLLGTMLIYNIDVQSVEKAHKNTVLIFIL